VIAVAVVPETSDVPSCDGGEWEAPKAPSPPAQSPSVRYPSRPVGTHWPATDLGRAEVLDLVLAASGEQAPSRRWTELRQGLFLLLDFFEEPPGSSWQERFAAIGADASRGDWVALAKRWLEGREEYSGARLALMEHSLLVAICADVIRPSLTWLFTGGKHLKLVRAMDAIRDPGGFAQLRLRCAKDVHVTPGGASRIPSRMAVILAAKGGTIRDITIGDFLEVLEVELGVRGDVRYASTSFKLLREMGIFGPEVPTLREIRSSGQRSVEELVDSYGLTCQPIRDLLVEYLNERRPSVDYTTIVRLAYTLAGCFWSDLERHHPDIDSLRLTVEVASAWKQRLRTKEARQENSKGGTLPVLLERLSYLDTLSLVRAFYLDLAEWALEDPDRFGRWVAPCPINRADLSRRKANRQRKARMDARTRERLPVLPVLVQTTNQWRRVSAALLAAARDANAGETFTVYGETLRRVHRPQAAPDHIWVEDPATGAKRLLNAEEDHAFWAWAIIEVLRLTGVRIEELLELSHHSFVEYRLPTSGELVPLLQIAPSKTDTERLLVVAPELAEVLEAIIRRVRDESGRVPLVRARDHHELVWMPPSPLLFQRVRGAERQRMNVQFVSTLLGAALGHSGLIDQSDAAPLRFTPHDFRRIFITDVIRNGLPPHIAQIIAGHQDLNVTMGYKAVYPDEAIQAHLAFLARRRALRPSEEYRTPSDDEWKEFLGHFERRKVSIGTCARAFGTPCVHEHACVRCSMLWPDDAQHGRLAEIRDSLVARIAEAKLEGWLGEVEGLELSLTGAEAKLHELDSRAERSVPVALRPARAHSAK
jgi:integrase